MKRFATMAAFGLLVLIFSAGDGPSDDKKGKGGNAKANDGVVSDWGKPTNYARGKFTAFWLWYEDGIWHFRTTGGGDGSHHFEGKIEVIGGKLIDIKGQKGEYGGGNVDRYVFKPKSIGFDFKTSGGEDGINFKVDAATKSLKFTVLIDGVAKPKHIRVGKDGDHPTEAAFTAPAHPTAVPAGGSSKGKNK